MKTGCFNKSQIDINLVLVRTIYPSNIGSVARVMGNMGARRLILVDPQCEINSKARESAAGAQKYLASRSTYSHWDEFYQNEMSGVRIGLTRRTGKLRTDISLNDVLPKLNLNLSESNPLQIYLVFGPEDHGLSADDLALLNFSASLPIFGEFPSMNLSHAVLLACYLVKDWAQALAIDQISPDDDVGHPKMKPQEGLIGKRKTSGLYFPDESIRIWLEEIGFSLEKRRASAYTTIRRLLLQNQPSETELHVLEAVLQQNIRKLRNASMASERSAGDSTPK
ncbi:MAG: RNA methyltransferase [Bdellovibrionales bacterium]|nr:RNA methyltransferase [Bdellovibrionales bacterium]